MPEIFGINSFLFQNLLRDFQVIAPPRSPVWYLSDTVIPVSLVNSQIVLDANISETAMQFATVGVLTVPAADALLADTGQLASGRWLFRCYLNWQDNNANSVNLEHRNPANDGNDWDFDFHVGATHTNRYEQEWVETVDQDERIRLKVRILAGAGSRFSGIIWRRRLGDI